VLNNKNFKWNAAYKTLRGMEIGTIQNALAKRYGERMRHPSYVSTRVLLDKMISKMVPMRTFVISEIFSKSKTKV